jgi:hypothetical protein
MNSAKIEKSERLRRVLSILGDGNPHSTRYIMMAAHVCAVNSIISELRDNGKKIKCKRDAGIYRYQMEVIK